jgi:hypothetical protein
MQSSYVDDGAALSRHCLWSSFESEKVSARMLFRSENAVLRSLLLVFNIAFIDSGGCTIHPTPQ